MSRAPWFSLVLPCRNQADHIGEVLKRYAAPLNTIGREYELIVVPNASQDATAEVVRKLAKHDGRLRVVENPAGGWGLSVLCGLRVARGEVLAYTNSARTNPEHVPGTRRTAEAQRVRHTQLQWTRTRRRTAADTTSRTAFRPRSDDTSTCSRSYSSQFRRTYVRAHRSERA